MPLSDRTGRAPTSWLAALVLALSACGETGVGAGHDIDAGPPESDGGESLFACALTRDCPIGHTCVGGICVKNEEVLQQGGCFSNADCTAPGQICDVFTGECFPKPDAGPASEELDAGPPPECHDGQLRSCGISKVGACRFGQEPCVDNRWSGQCVGAIYPVAVEACDDQDDDCDGLVDEDYDKRGSVQHCGGCGRSCSFPQAAARCEDGTCVMGACDPDWWNLDGREINGCEYPCRYTGPEVCDGEDNDCDGDFDEDFRGISESCGTGACASTVAICDNGVPRSCQPLPSGPELCNNVDDSCDGQTDEGFLATCGLGACRRTVDECVDGVYTACTPDLARRMAETCNGIDDDCDGSTDEDFVGKVITCGEGICFRSVPACVAGVPQSCVAGAPQPNEICEVQRLDEDCDGLVNEGCGCDGMDLGDEIPCYTGPTSTRGVGACKDGVQTCVALPGGGQDWGPCLFQTLPAASESCNGVDDDCDGSTDEGFGNLTCGVGECIRSVPACLNGAVNTCTPLPPSPPEGDAATALCDGKDNDCDGLVDEGYTNVTCGLGECVVQKPRCAGGVYDPSCTPRAPGPAEGVALPSTCNGKDDDCDGQTDEGFFTSCGFGLCRRTVQTCVGGTYAACTPDTSKARSELGQGCNGLDDDCDGATDEDFTDGDRDGVASCLDCDDQNGTTFPGAAEQCNGVDDDCDGQTDEAFDSDNDGWSRCSTDPTKVDCNDNAPSIHPGATEICGNSIDENCDGYAESCDCTRDNDGDGYKGGSGNRVCPDCNDGRADVHPGAPEKCDGLDNDCDVRTTENCGVDQFCDWGTTADGCSEGLLCGRRNTDGRYICSSLCNWSLDSGLDDGCGPAQSCWYIYSPSANMHACGVPASAVGTKKAGEPAASAGECKSYRIVTDASGTYCTDYCADDTYCTPNDPTPANRTFCRITQVAIPDGPSVRQVLTGRCEKVPSTYLPHGQACIAAGADSSSECRNGDLACQGGRCLQPCCNDSHCPAGHHCSPTGANTIYGLVDNPGNANDYYLFTTVPVCMPNAAQNGGRRAGDACTRNDQCLSEFCERSALSGDGVNGKCVELCCNQSSCSGTTTCEQVDIQIPTLYNGAPQRVSARACVHLPLGQPFLRLQAN